MAAAAHAAAPRVVKIKGTDAMQYDVKRIEAKPGEELEVQLSTVSAMSKQEMAHNFTLLAKDTPVDAFVMEAAMARIDRLHPGGQEELRPRAHPLAGGGETVKVTFNAPKEPGEYLYICTFPGHYLAGMKGMLVVK